MKPRTIAIAAFAAVAVITVAYIAFGGSPCGRVKAGSVDFMDSPACIKECAQDGGDCPYNAGARAPDAP